MDLSLNKKIKNQENTEIQYNINLNNNLGDKNVI